jgi:hypothetical protein
MSTPILIVSEAILARIAAIRTTDPKSRVVGPFKHASSSANVGGKECVLCGEQGPTWSKKYKQTKKAIAWEIAHLAMHEKECASTPGFRLRVGQENGMNQAQRMRRRAKADFQRAKEADTAFARQTQKRVKEDCKRMTLAYWIADNLVDSPCYSIRARTREICAERKRAEGEYAKNYASPRKIVVEYRDAFDLVAKALGEGGVE